MQQMKTIENEKARFELFEAAHFQISWLCGTHRECFAPSPGWNTARWFKYGGARQLVGRLASSAPTAPWRAIFWEFWWCFALCVKYEIWINTPNSDIETTIKKLCPHLGFRFWGGLALELWGSQGRHMNTIWRRKSESAWNSMPGRFGTCPWQEIKLGSRIW